MTQDTHAPNTEHPIALGSFRNWLRLLWKSEGIDLAFIPRTLFVSLTTLLTSPLRLCEQVRYGSAIGSTAIHPSPIFIIGHWRTGTTHLHNLICQDRNLGYVSLFQGIAPGFCLVGDKAIKPVLAAWARRTHPTRIIDNIPLLFDAPQEEEFAVASLSPHSFLHSFTFPRQAPCYFERYALFRDLSESARAEWTEVYLAVLRKASFRTGGKRLVLKNPANSGRIQALLDLFPDAKFIHIYRNPYDVYLSTVWTYRTVVPRSQVQEIDVEQIEAYVLQFYAQLMQKFLVDKAFIPSGNLVEVRFEDLEVAPLAEMRRVYSSLSLPGFAQAEPAMRAYLASIVGYQKNGHKLEDRAIAQVNRHWQFAFDAWGYKRLEPSLWHDLEKPHTLEQALSERC
jgi:hypothetical protein